MKRSGTTIIKKYEKFVRHMEQACKSLDWKVKFEQDVDEILFVDIDKCRFFVSSVPNQPPEFPLFSASVMVHHPGNREEPPSEDDAPIGTPVRRAELLVGTILDAQWAQRKEWAMEATYDPEPEENF